MRYESFLVRLWAEGDPLRWRASARNIHSGEDVLFPSIEHLFAYLQQHVTTRQSKKDE